MKTMVEPQVGRDIPSHVLLFHILPRLPVCSLQRFRSVCKQWYSFLKTRAFANMHNHRVTNGDHQLKPKLVVLSTTKSTLSFLSTTLQIKFRIIDCEALDDASGDSRPLPFKANLKDIHILTSLHGLVCVSMVTYGSAYGYFDLVLWNPLTGEYKNVMESDSNMKSHLIALGLYYSNSEDDYKLVIVLHDHSVHIYSLKSDSWRKVDSTDNYQTLSDLGSACWRVSTWLNGDLYFLYRGYKESSIIKFDTNIERFTVIPTHPSLKDLDVKCLSMTVKRGVIHLVVKYEMSRDEYSKNAYIQLWRMIGDDGNWEKVGGPYRADNSMDPFHWIRNKTFLMIKDKENLCKVDVNKKFYTGIGKVKGVTFSYTCVNMGTSPETVKYTETFMSLDRSI